MVRNAAPNSTIKFAAYTLQDTHSNSAGKKDDLITELIKAHDARKVKVQIIVRPGIDQSGDARVVNDYRKLVAHLGTDPTKSSFIMKCERSCRSGRGSDTNSMHHKFFLFSNTSGAQKFALGSFNPSAYAQLNQWNDLIIGQNSCSYTELSAIFQEMRVQKRGDYREPKLCGKYYINAFPQADSGPDIIRDGLNNVHCTRTGSGAGTASRKTLVLVHMTNGSGDKGLVYAKRLHVLKNAGCDVRVIYGGASNISDEVRKELATVKHVTAHPGSPRTHMKTVIISGVYRNNPSSNLVYTGSLVFGEGTEFRDDLAVRIADATVTKQYINNFNSVWRAYNAYNASNKSNSQQRLAPTVPPEVDYEQDL